MAHVSNSGSGSDYWALECDIAIGLVGGSLAARAATVNSSLCSTAPRGTAMDWERVLSLQEADIDADDALSGALFEFLLSHPLSSGSELLSDPGKAAKLLSVTQTVMKVSWRAWVGWND